MYLILSVDPVSLSLGAISWFVVCECQFPAHTHLLFDVYRLSNSYTMRCPPVRGDNPRA